MEIQFDISNCWRQRWADKWDCYLWFIVAKTSQLIDKENAHKETIMNMAAECVRFELGIKEIPTPNPYSILLEEESKPWKDIQDHHKEIMDKQKAVELSLNQSVEFLPTRASLLSKMTVKCSECSKKGVFGLVYKPQVQPLIGDSSLFGYHKRVIGRANGNETWYRVANFGVFSVPQVTVVHKEEEKLVLRIRNVDLL